MTEPTKTIKSIPSSSNLSSIAFDYIQQRILTEEFSPDQLLNEKEIAAKLNVSRTPVREAIKQLTVDGLVKLEQNRGAVVVGLTEEDMNNILLIRAFLEGLCCKRAAKKFSPEQIDTLQELVSLQQFYLDREKYEDSWEIGRRFHEYLYQNCGSRHVTSLLVTYHTYIYWRLQRHVINNAEYCTYSLKKHIEVLEAIRDHDAISAERIMKEHLETTMTSLSRNQDN